MIKKIKHKVLQSKAYNRGYKALAAIKLPGFGGMPVLHVLSFFLHTAQKGSLTNRAAAVSFKFFMALFPGIIFLITIIPYIPVPNFHRQLLIAIQGLLPDQVYPMIEKTIVDVVKNRQTGLLSLGFLFAAFFSTNGMNGLMKAFNESAFITETRKPIKQRGIAMLLTLMVLLTIIITVTGIVVSNRIIISSFKHGLIGNTWMHIWLTLKWIPIFVILYFFMAGVFYLAPSKSMRVGFFSTGALASTFCSILFTYLITIYINNFNSYNKIYGVLGAFPVILIWIFLNALSLLIGFELNVSIRHAGNQKN